MPAKRLSGMGSIVGCMPRTRVIKGVANLARLQSLAVQSFDSRRRMMSGDVSSARRCAYIFAT